MSTRAERIENLLTQNNSRLNIAEMTEQLKVLEQIALHPSTVSATVTQDNRTREGQGLVPRFNVYGDGTESWDWISLRQPPTPQGAVPAVLTPSALIEEEEENGKVRARLKEAMQDLSWQEFEANFLFIILEALGFHRIQLTQRTRDGDIDAYCTYQ